MRQGQSLGRPPLGYHFTPVVRPERRRPPAYGGAWSRIGCDCADRASWTVCAPGAALVRRIFDEYSTGTVSACDLVARLNADRPQLRRWQRDTVLYILKNPIYRGTVRDALTGDTYPGRHPAIIDSEEFDHVQVVLARRRMERRRVASLGRAYPLQGLLHCAGCGQRMRAVSMWRRRPDGSVAIYDSYAEWNRRIRGIECAAPQVQLTALIPDGQIRDILATIPIGRRVDDLDVDVGAPMAADLDRRRARLDERLRRVNRMYEMGTIAEEEYEERVAGVRRERSQLEAAPRRPPIELVRLALERLRLCNLVGGDRATIRDLVRLVLERVDFDTGARRVVALRGTFGAAPLLRTSPALRETEPGVFVPDPPLAPGPRPRALGGVKPPGPALRLRRDDSLGLNAPAFAALGYATHVRVALDGGRLAIAPAASHDQTVLRLSPHGVYSAQIRRVWLSKAIRGVTGTPRGVPVDFPSVRVEAGAIVADIPTVGPAT